MNLLEAERTDKKQTKKGNTGQMINVMEKSKARLVHREYLEQECVCEFQMKWSGRSI